MFEFDYQIFMSNISGSIIESIQFYSPKVLGALILILIGVFSGIIAYKFVLYAFKKFKLIELIDKLTIDFEDIAHVPENLEKNGEKKKKFSQRVKIDQIFGKALGYYLFLVFFRLSIVAIGIEDIENFLGDLLTYLPSLFIAVVILFFGVRFANFIYDVTYQTLKLTKQKTAKIIASGGKIIILFFTVMVVLDKIGIATEITTVILTGFVGMLALAGGIAFGLGGKEVAQEILESFRK